MAAVEATTGAATDSAIIAASLGSGTGGANANRSQNRLTSSGSNWVPAWRRSSAMAALCPIARLYGRSLVIAA